MTTYAVEYTTRVCQKCRETALAHGDISVRAGTTKLNDSRGRLRVELVCEHMSSPSDAE